MAPTLSFIVPVRHHENSKNWNDTVRYLKQTLGSISNQRGKDWNCLVVVNSSSDTPDFNDERIITITVDFEPNELHEKGSHSLEEFY
jgi:glycosyltransferase involved in cell wall biosynthesis